MKILITGGTGFLGKPLAKLLTENGHEIYIVTRNQKSAKIKLPFISHFIEGDLNQAPLQDPRLSEIEGVIHLAGETISGLWTLPKKEAIYTSRVEGSKNLRQSLESAALKVWIGASAIGYYGDRGDEQLTEETQPGEGFLANVVKDWEQAQTLKTPLLRQVFLRLGVILDTQEGAFPLMAKPFQYGLGATLGSGHQWMSWISSHDAIRLFAWCLESTQAHGPINAVSPHPLQNETMSQRLRAYYHKPIAVPSWFKVPSILLKTSLGEMSGLLLASQKVSSEKIQKLGFTFENAEFESWLKTSP